jgi:hypothetical protein
MAFLAPYVSSILGSWESAEKVARMLVELPINEVCNLLYSYERMRELTFFASMEVAKRARGQVKV